MSVMVVLLIRTPSLDLHVIFNFIIRMVFFLFFNVKWKIYSLISIENKQQNIIALRHKNEESRKRARARVCVQWFGCHHCYYDPVLYVSISNVQQQSAQIISYRFKLEQNPSSFMTCWCRTSTICILPQMRQIILFVC